MTDSPDVLGANAQTMIRSVVERLERLDADADAIKADRKEVLAEAKGNGLCTKTLNAVVKLRKQDRAKRQEAESMLDLYLSAIGDLPLFSGRA